MTRPPTMGEIARHGILAMVLMGILITQLQLAATIGVRDFGAVQEISLFAGILYMILPFVEWGWRLAAERIESAGDAATEEA